MTSQRDYKINRRRFLRATSGFALSGLALEISANSAEPNYGVPELAGKIGIVTASAQAQLTGKAQGRNLSLLELPKILREELDMTVIDLNTSAFPDFGAVEASYLEKFRAAAEKVGCVITNLKMNQPGLDMNSKHESVRRKALEEYKRSIEIASQLGCRWARPLPGKDKPDMAIHVASYRELCEFAAERKVQMLVENFGWMQAEADSVAKLVKAIGKNIAAGVDIGNWDNSNLRYEGLKQSFPLAATCDFKARKLGPKVEHPLYDLKRCFEIAWAAGFRGPWCFEHANADTVALFRELAMLRDKLREWTKERSK